MNVPENFLMNVPESVPENVLVLVGYKIVRSTSSPGFINTKGLLLEFTFNLF